MLPCNSDHLLTDGLGFTRWCSDACRSVVGL